MDGGFRRPSLCEEATMEQLTFEEAFAQLEETVQALERGQLPLAEALATFERGMRLAELCDHLLTEADLRVRQLVPDGGGGVRAVEFEGWQDEQAA